MYFISWSAGVLSNHNLQILVCKAWPLKHKEGGWTYLTFMDFHNSTVCINVSTLHAWLTGTAHWLNIANCGLHSVFSLRFKVSHNLIATITNIMVKILLIKMQLGTALAQWLGSQTPNQEVPGSNRIATALEPLGKALYPHYLSPWRCKASSLLVSSLLVLLS